MNPRERGGKLLDAIVEDKQDVALKILKQGADLTALRKGDNALHLAARKGWLGFIKAMKAAGAELEQKNQNGNTAMHYAAKGGFLAMVTYLKDSGCDLNTCNNDGYAPLHDAVIHQSMDVIEKLVDLGMDPNLQNKITGETPLHTAAIFGRQPALEGLLIKGASSKIKDVNHKKPEDVGKSPVFRQIIRMYDALRIAIKKGYIKAQGRKLDVESVTEPVVIARVGIIIEHIDIPSEFPTAFYCRREKSENATVKLRHHDEESVFSDVFHVQIADVQRDCDVKMLVPLYKAPAKKEQMMLRFENREDDSDKPLTETIKKGKKHYCVVETTLVPETPCVFVINVRPKQETTKISKEETQIKSEIEREFALTIPAKAFAENTTLSLKVYDAEEEGTDDSDESITDAKEKKEESGPPDKTKVGGTSTSERKAKDIDTEPANNAATKPVDTGLVTDVFQITISGDQPKKNVTMQLPMLKNCTETQDIVIIRTDERTLHDKTPPEVLPVKPNVVQGNLIFEVSHFSIYVASPREKSATEEDLMSIKSRISSAKDKKKAATFFAVIKHVDEYKHTLLVDCGPSKISQRRFDKWLKEEYEIQTPNQSEAMMLAPGDTFYVSIKGNAGFEDRRDADERKLTFSQCRASFQAFNIHLARHARQPEDGRATVVVSRKVDNGLKEVARLPIKLFVPPPPPSWKAMDQHAHKSEDGRATVVVSRKVDNGLKEMVRLPIKLFVPPHPPFWKAMAK